MPKKSYAKNRRFFSFTSEKIRFFGSKNHKNYFFEKMANRVLQNVIAVIMKKKSVEYEYPDSLTFF